jgi:hypothetical protein
VQWNKAIPAQPMVPLAPAFIVVGADRLDLFRLLPAFFDLFRPFFDLFMYFNLFIISDLFQPFRLSQLADICFGSSKLKKYSFKNHVRQFKRQKDFKISQKFRF